MMRHNPFMYPIGLFLAFAVVMTALSPVAAHASQAATPASPAAESKEPAIEAKVDALFSKWNSLDSPGAAVAIVKDGLVIYRKGFGSAQLKYGIPITPSTVFHVASVSKQFTAWPSQCSRRPGSSPMKQNY